MLIDCNTINHLVTSQFHQIAGKIPLLRQVNPLPTLPDVCKVAMTVNGVVNK